jgi:rhomboid protease GluP
MLKRAPLTRAILVVIALVYVGEIFDAQRMLDGGAIIPGLLASGQYWRLITSMFLHAPPSEPYGLGWMHVLANSWAIFQLGTLYEVLFGSKRFALVYFISGVCAGIASSLYTNAEAVGASGAVFGLLGAFIFSIWRSPQYRHQRWTKSLLGQIVFWTVLNLYIGSQFPFVDNVAHIGGLVAGLLLGFIPHRVPPPSPASTVIDVHPYDDGGF